MPPTTSQYDFLTSGRPPSDLEDRFRHYDRSNTLMASVKLRERKYLVKFILSDDVVEGAERRRIDFTLTASTAANLLTGVTRQREERLEEGTELMLQWSTIANGWALSDTPYTPLSQQPRYVGDPQPFETEALPRVTRNRAVLDIDEYAALPEEVRNQIEYANEDRRVAQVRFRNLQSQYRDLNRRLDNAERLERDQHNLSVDLQRRLDISEQNLREASRQLLAAQATERHRASIEQDTDTLRRTATVWRDASNGTPAKLKAFKEFCTALDSLPALDAAE